MSNYEKYSEVYRKNAEKMAVLKVLADTARKNGDKEAARRYRAQYTDLKAEIDAAVFAVITENRNA